jgi:hypothetical protein
VAAPAPAPVARIVGVHAQVLSSAELTLWARVEALDGRLLTREELATRVGELTTPALGDKLRESWGALLKPAAALGLLCFATSQGQQVRFTRPDSWLGGWAGHDPEAAMDAVSRRFLAASGPVTREDFARWWGIPSPARAARLLERLGEEVARVEVEGTAAYTLAADLAGLAAAGPGGPRTVRLLPAFDQYVVTATLQAQRLMPGPFKARVYRPQGWLSPVLLVGGRLEGVWRQEAKGRRLVVTIEPFAGPPPARVGRAAEAEAERLAAFSGAELELRWADPAAPGGAATG